MERTRRNLLVLAILCTGIALFVLAQGQEASGASASPIVEALRYELLPDGRTKEVRALIDTRLADPAEVMAKLAPGATSDPEVAAAFLASRKWAASAIPVPVLYNASSDPSGISGASPLQWAMNAWNGVANQSFRFSNAGSTSVYTPTCDLNYGDGQNTVRFSYLLEVGVLGETCSLLGDVVGGYVEVIEFDMHLDGFTHWATAVPTPEWAYDLHSVVLHELGHALGLGHSSDGTVMQVYLDYGQQFRTFTADDIAGIQALYGTPTTPTATKTATPTKTPTEGSVTATTTPGNWNYKLFAGMLGRDAPASTSPPAPRTITPMIPTTTATPTPTQSPVSLSEITDGDEPDVLFNDIEWASMTGSQSKVDIAIRSRHPSGFSFYNNGLGDESYVAVRFYFTSTGIGDEDLYAVIDHSEIRVYRTTGAKFDRVHTAYWAGSGGTIAFSLPRSLFSSGIIHWDVTGAEASSFPDCSLGFCSWFDYDRAPEVLAPKPSFTLR